MQLVSFEHLNQDRIGALIDDYVVDVKNHTAIAANMIEFLAGGDAQLKHMQRCIDSGNDRIPLSEVKLLAPVPRPGKFLAISLNYAEHIHETGMEKPEFPNFFNKQSSCIIADGDPIHRPKVSNKLDYEGELAFVIGKRCRHVSREQAKQVIAGFTIVNDVSVRDWQFRSPTFTLGKSFDTHGPVGPTIVTSDQIPDPHNLNIKTWVDDQLRQDSNTRHMIFDCYDMVEYLSTVMTLEPGDIISTGTPSGVGVKMQPRGYLVPGQSVRIEIEKLGCLVNPVIEEPEGWVLPAQNSAH